MHVLFLKNLIKLFVLFIFIFSWYNSWAQINDIIRISNDPADDINPQIIVDKFNRIWIFWESNRNGTWDIYAKYFNQQELSDLIIVTNDPTYISRNFSVTVDSDENICIAWLVKDNEIYFKKYNYEYWSEPDSISLYGIQPSICSGHNNSLWIFWEKTPDVCVRYFNGEIWENSNVIMEGIDASLFYRFYGSDIKSLYSSSDMPWVIFEEAGHVSGGHYWSTIHAAYYQDTTWSKIIVASGDESQDIFPKTSVYFLETASDNSNKIYIAYHYSHSNIDSTKNYLRSYNAYNGELLDQITLLNVGAFCFSDYSNVLVNIYPHNYYYTNSILAQTLKDTLLLEPKLICKDTTSTTYLYDSPSVTIDKSNNIWIAWEARMSIEGYYILLSSVPCSLLTGLSNNYVSLNHQYNYQLYQNYPNPFNSVTVIRYSLNQSNFVTLEIYNMIGQKIRTLISGWHQPGCYKVNWYGFDDFQKSMPSGIYLYFLKIGNRTHSKKAILIR